MLIVYHVNLVRAISCEFVFRLKISAFLIITIDWFDSGNEKRIDQRTRETFQKLSIALVSDIYKDKRTCKSTLKQSLA